MRRTPRSSAAICPARSPSAEPGRRVLRSRMSTMSVFVVPARARRTGGSTNASWNTSVAPGL